MTNLTPQQIADLKASIAAKYTIDVYDIDWYVVVGPDGHAVSNSDHDDPLSAEAELEDIIQDDVKAAMEEME